VAAAIADVEPPAATALPTPPADPEYPTEIAATSTSAAAPFAILAILLFGLLAAVWQALKNDPMLVQRWIRRFDGLRRGGQLRHGASHHAGGSNAATMTDAHTKWPTLEIDQITPPPTVDAGASATVVQPAGSSVGLGGGHANGLGKTGPSGVQFDGQVTNGSTPSVAQANGQLGGASGADGTGQSFGKVGHRLIDTVPSAQPVASVSTPPAPAGGALGGGHGGATLAQASPGASGTLANGSLGGGHGGASLAQGQPGGSSLASGSIGGGHPGGTLAQGPAPAPNVANAPTVGNAGQPGIVGTLDGSVVGSASPLTAGTVAGAASGGGLGGAVSAGASAGQLLGGLGSAGLAAGAIARAETSELSDVDACRHCGGTPGYGARFCGYCGEALDSTIV
jgi:hypothetical protein